MSYNIMKWKRLITSEVIYKENKQINEKGELSFCLKGFELPFCRRFETAYSHKTLMGISFFYRFLVILHKKAIVMLIKNTDATFLFLL